MEGLPLPKKIGHTFSSTAQLTGRFQPGAFFSWYIHWLRINPEAGGGACSPREPIFASNLLRVWHVKRQRTLMVWWTFILRRVFWLVLRWFSWAKGARSRMNWLSVFITMLSKYVFESKGVLALVHDAFAPLWLKAKRRTFSKFGFLALLSNRSRIICVSQLKSDLWLIDHNIQTYWCGIMVLSLAVILHLV